MMNAASRLTSLLQGTLPYHYYVRRVVLVHAPTLLKARLYVSPQVFVQVYRNDDYDSTSFVVVAHGNRLYGRDQLRGKWHRHPHDNPDTHDTGTEGAYSVDLLQFLAEADAVLKKAGLIPQQLGLPEIEE